MRDPREVIVRPVVTERSMGLSTGDNGEPQYAFIVAKDANKVEIKNAVEKLFNVSVAHVNTMNYRGKARRVGRHLGRHEHLRLRLSRHLVGEHHRQRHQHAVVHLRHGQLGEDQRGERDAGSGGRRERGRSVFAEGRRRFDDALYQRVGQCD